MFAPPAESRMTLEDVGITSKEVYVCVHFSDADDESLLVNRGAYHL